MGNGPVSAGICMLGPQVCGVVREVMEPFGGGGHTSLGWALSVCSPSAFPVSVLCFMLAFRFELTAFGSCCPAFPP